MRPLLATAALAAAVTFAAPAHAASIDLASLNVAGSAKIVDGDLQLTHTSSVSNASGVSGAGWVADAISTTTSFTTSFTFSMQGNDSGSMADGIALAFQNVGNNVTGVGGGDVGYWNIGGSGSSAVGSVIRTWTNNDYGLSTNGVVQGLTPAGWDMGAANYVTGAQTVSYDATTHVLSLTGQLVNAKTGAVYSITDTETVDLSAKFGATMYVGFTGATAGADADQRITSFSVSSIGAVSAVPEADSYAMLMAGLGLVGWTARRRQRNA